MIHIKKMIIVALCCFSLHAENLINVPDADSEPASKKATKEETGILSSMITMYAQVRNAVKYAYDEIQYFRGIKNTVEDMQHWWKESKEKIQYLKQSVVEFPLEKGSVFVKLEKAEEIFDRIDDLAFNQTAEFDRLAGAMEYYIDTLIENPYMDGKGTAHRVIFAPTTEQLAARLTEWSEQVPWQSVGKTQADIRKKELTDYAPDPEVAYQHEVDHASIYNKISHDSQDEDIIAISKEVAAHVLANSNMYEQWAVQATRNAAKLEEKFKKANIKGMNELELQTAWWMLEQLNATNKQIVHSELELKAYIAMLGIDIYETTEKRNVQIVQTVSARQLARP